jgi:P-type Cu2+ transporter
MIDKDNKKNIFDDTVTQTDWSANERKTIKSTFPLLRMSCSSCALSVESMLKAYKGVLSAKVNFEMATVTIEYVPAVVTAAQLQKAVQSLKYNFVVPIDTNEEGTTEERQQRHYQQLKKETMAAALLSVAIVVIGVFYANMSYVNEIKWVLATVVVLWLGKDFFINACKQARYCSANSDTLVALSTGVAYLFSMFNTLFPRFWQGRGVEVHLYFEGATVVIALILLGKLLVEKAKSSTSTTLNILKDLQPKTVTMIKEDKQQRQIQLDELVNGNIIRVNPGEKIAADGEVVLGSSYVDESILSGEPTPVLKVEGEKVYAGTVNQKGSFEYRAVKIGVETVLANIIQMVYDAKGSKAPVQKLVDKIARIFVPVVIGIAIFSFVGWQLFGGENAFTQGMLALVSVLIIACPCALSLATPTAILLGVGKGAESGILIKDAESLELVRKINTLVVDKTGTLTEGIPAVTQTYWLRDTETSKRILYSIEKQSEHPLAAAVAAYYDSLETLPVQLFESIHGKGATAVYDGITYWVGNEQLMEAHNLEQTDEMFALAYSWRKAAQTVIWFADDYEVHGLLAIADKVKETSPEAIQRLKNMDIEVYMLTGDNQATAKAIAEQTGILHFSAGVLPEQKVAFVQQLQAEGKQVAMAGNGINDSAALEQANLGIAMGKESDFAMNVAKITIISSDLLKIPAAIQLAKDTVATVWQNLFWVFVYNIIGITIAAGILYPVTGVLLNPTILGAIMILSSVSVVTNSLRLKWT